MNEHHEDDPRHEAIGSVGEEAAKLFAALSGWSRDHGADDAGEHLAQDDPDCRYCPMCQVIHAVRTTSPEVKEHLAAAASSLVHAAAAVLGSPLPSDKSTPVEKIDLDDTDWES